MTAFGGPRGAGYEVIDESKLRRKRTCEAEKSPKKAVVRAYSCSDHGTIIAGRRNRHGARCFGFARYTVSLPLTAYLWPPHGRHGRHEASPSLQTEFVDRC